MKTNHHSLNLRKSAPVILAVLFGVWTSTATFAQRASGTPDSPSYETMTELEQEAAVLLERCASFWAEFGENVERALAAGDDNLTVSALQMIIFYGRNFRIDRVATNDILQVYSRHENDHIRRMAVVALGRIGGPRIINALKTSAQSEQNAAVLHTIQAVLEELEAIEPGPALVANK